VWNVARFAERFIEQGKGVKGTGESNQSLIPYPRSPADAWILSRGQKLVRRATTHLQAYDYAAAKSEIEAFFWTELADNYLEMAKQRLYDPVEPTHNAACYTLRHILFTVLKLLAPFLPYVTEEIYQQIGEQRIGERGSIHHQRWPQADPALENEAAEALGQALIEIATTVRRYKSEHNLPLGAELDRVQLAAVEGTVSDLEALQASVCDLKSITRAREITFGAAFNQEVEFARLEGLRISIQ
jgi:valyl-tRNA synthetase